jgi:pyrroloquinoline quinone biosynthesis protein B
MNYKLYLFLLIVISCKKQETAKTQEVQSSTYIIVLGIAQDAGFPQINNPSEFELLKNGARQQELVVALGLVDKVAKKKYLFEATPDMPKQLDLLGKEFRTEAIVDGVFLTHAHIGHYTGLMYFGHEAMGAKDIKVFVMPKMSAFLSDNAPWSQLVAYNNITLTEMEENTSIQLTSQLKVIPFLVPHRDEFSETVGYKIIGTNKSALFIPDINKWGMWNKNIIDEVQQVDYAIIDATFFAEGEIPRPMSQIPHPFIEETVALFEKESKLLKSKIIFIHFNHSNPALNLQNTRRLQLEAEGYRFAYQGMELGL